MIENTVTYGMYPTKCLILIEKQVAVKFHCFQSFKLELHKKNKYFYKIVSVNCSLKEIAVT